MSDRLERITDWFVEDILSLTDGEVLDEVREDERAMIWMWICRWCGKTNRHPGPCRKCGWLR